MDPAGGVPMCVNGRPTLITLVFGVLIKERIDSDSAESAVNPLRSNVQCEGLEKGDRV